MTDVPAVAPDKVRHNAFSDNLKTDHIAVDLDGNILARSFDRASVQSAAPTAAAYFTGADFNKEAAAAESVDEPVADAPPVKASKPDKAPPVDDKGGKSAAVGKAK